MINSPGQSEVPIIVTYLKYGPIFNISQRIIQKYSFKKRVLNNYLKKMG